MKLTPWETIIFGYLATIGAVGALVTLAIIPAAVVAVFALVVFGMVAAG